MFLSANGVAQAVAGGIKIGEQAFDILFRWVAVGRSFQWRQRWWLRSVFRSFVGVGVFGDDVGKELAGVDEVAFGFNGIVFDVCRDHLIAQRGVMNTVVIGLNIESKVFTDEAVKQGAEDILFEIPAVH